MKKSSNKLNISQLKLIAKSQGMTVKQFAPAIGMTFQGWHNAEKNGDMKMSVFFRACEVLGIEDSVLIKPLNPNYDGDSEDFVKQQLIAAEPQSDYAAKSTLNALKFIEENKSDLLKLMEKMKKEKGSGTP